MARFFYVLVCFCLFSSLLFAEVDFEEPVQATILVEEQTVQPGRPFWVGIKMKIADGWHTYWKNPGDAGMPTAITWTLPPGFEASSTMWPVPQKFAVDSTIGFGYEEEAFFLTLITPPASFDAATADIAAELRWVVCSDSTCLPGDADLKLALQVQKDLPVPNSAVAAEFEKAREIAPHKLDNMTVQRSQDLIEIAFNMEDVPHNTQFIASFFPESENTIDHTIQPVFTPSNESHPHSVILKTAPDATASHLKGVLVLKSADQEVAYEVEHPIKPTQEELIGDTGPLAAQNQEASINEFEGGLGLALVLAFVGGLILNLMPCVLPVISFKILSFVKLAGQSRSLIFKHGAAFSLGVLFSFWVLAGALLILQAYGRSVGWGFQLQDPLFVAILASVLLIFGLSLFGLFEIGTSLISLGGQTSKKHGALAGSFLSGILATAVATPCTGPFLGSAVGFAVTLPPALALLIFTSLGLGMSLPYLILSGFPSLLRFLPKSGPWMNTFRELMGFFMLATVLWLIWVFGAQTSTFSLTLLLAGFFLLAIGGWIYGKWGMPFQSRTTRLLGCSTAFTCLLIAVVSIYNASTPWAAEMGSEPSSASHAAASKDSWERFSPERVAELRDKGIPVFIDFTAKWCLICQANHLILKLDQIDQEFSSRGVVKMKADWTKNDPIITAELRKYGRSGVPLYLFYGSNPKEPPAILPQVLTPEIVMGHLNKIDAES